MTMTNAKLNTEIKEIVIARLQTIPDQFKLSLGGHGVYTKKQVIDEVKQETEVGKKMMEIQINYLRSLKNHRT